MLITLLLKLIIPFYYSLVKKAQRTIIKKINAANQYSNASANSIIFLLEVREMLPLPAST